MKTKPRNYSFEQLKIYIDEYWRDEVKGDPAKLTYTALAEYTSKRMNMQVYDRNYSRNPEAKEYILNLKTGKTTLPGMPSLHTYKCMSMETISKVACDYAKAVKTIQELDVRCQDNTEEMNLLRNTIIEKDHLIDKLTQEISLLKTRPAVEADILLYKNLVKAYRTFTSDYVHQDIAHALYENTYTFNSNGEYTGKVLTKEALKTLIEGQKPEPVPHGVLPEEKQTDTAENIRNLADYVRNNAGIRHPAERKDV